MRQKRTTDDEGASPWRQDGDDEGGELDHRGEHPRRGAPPEAERDEGPDDQQNEEPEPVQYLLASDLQRP